MTGRIKLFVAALFIGMVLPWNFWELLEEVSKNPDIAKLILFVMGGVLVVYAFYVVIKSLNGNEGR